MNRYKKVILELIKFPESQEVIDNPDWFPIVDVRGFLFGDSAYARVLDDSEYILVEKTTADEFNNDIKELNKLRKHNDDHIIQSDLEEAIDDCMITYRDPGDENEG